MRFKAPSSDSSIIFIFYFFTSNVQVFLTRLLLILLEAGLLLWGINKNHHELRIIVLQTHLDLHHCRFQGK